jgi:hypothetical protein
MVGIWLFQEIFCQMLSLGAGKVNQIFAPRRQIDVKYFGARIKTIKSTVPWE